MPEQNHFFGLFGFWEWVDYQWNYGSGCVPVKSGWAGFEVGKSVLRYGWFVFAYE